MRAVQKVTDNGTNQDAAAARSGAEHGPKKAVDSLRYSRSAIAALPITEALYSDTEPCTRTTSASNSARNNKTCRLMPDRGRPMRGMGRRKRGDEGTAFLGPCSAPLRASNFAKDASTSNFARSTLSVAVNHCSMLNVPPG